MVASISTKWFWNLVRSDFSIQSYRVSDILGQGFWRPICLDSSMLASFPVAKCFRISTCLYLRVLGESEESWLESILMLKDEGTGCGFWISKEEIAERDVEATWVPLLMSKLSPASETARLERSWIAGPWRLHCHQIQNQNQILTQHETASHHIKSHSVHVQ